MRPGPPTRGHFFLALVPFFWAFAGLAAVDLAWVTPLLFFAVMMPSHLETKAPVTLGRAQSQENLTSGTSVARSVFRP